VDQALKGIKLQDRGVFVQASTLGSLEALLEFLKQSKIPFAGKFKVILLTALKLHPILS